MKLSILYRGPLSSCNYGCVYCPFAKHVETDEEHAADGRALERFVDWVSTSEHRISILFTPWGEALVRKRYQRAIVRLTNMANVDKVAIQTNLSCRLDWIDECDRSRLGLWATYHPTQVEQASFLARVLEADRRGARISVGMVGMKEHSAEIEAMRAALPPHIYLWVNAYKRDPEYYTEDDVRFLTSIDPLFPINNTRHPSLGRECCAGESVISVDGNGDIRRCHFIKSVIGNIYEPGWEQALKPRLCSNETCGCHIGYVHLPHLKLYEVFGNGVLERIPSPQSELLASTLAPHD